MRERPAVPIGELVTPVRMWAPDREAPDEPFTYIDLSAVDQHAKEIRGERQIVGAEAPSRARQVVASGDVLVSTVRPNLNGVARVPPEMDQATASTGFCVLRPEPEKLDGAYLFHWVRSSRFVAEMMKRATGASYPAISDRIVFESRLPLPPLLEQRRIAEILDKAEALRAKRRGALAALDTLNQAIFFDMFGDPNENPKRWPTSVLRKVIAVPLRNGLSPSTAGAVRAKVLTLSAITGSRFEPDSWKVGAFHLKPPKDQSVDRQDFLICRGNGNVSLVGRGFFPTAEMPDVTFPDTMIAARISSAVIERTFFQQLWNTNSVRRQIQSLARTTNGTFKINQHLLEAVSLILPPRELQNEFARRADAVEKSRAIQRASTASVDDLFASLQDRAFRGEL